MEITIWQYHILYTYTMGSRFIFFLVFASLAQSSYVPTATLKISYGLSEQELAVLNEITVNQEESRIAYLDGLKSIFNILLNLATRLIFNPEAETPHYSFDLVKAFIRVKNAIDLSLDSVVLSLEKSCSTVEVTRNRTHDYLDDALAQVTGAIKLAQCGNYSENRVTIEVYQAAVQIDFTNLVESVYDSIYTCLGTTDDDTSVVIENFQNKSHVGLVHMTNALFNAIKVYAVAVTIGYADITLVTEIEDCHSKARVGLVNDVENEFSLHKTLYINSHLNQSGIVLGLAANQYALTASYHSYKEGFEVLFQTVKYYLRRPAFGLYDDGENDFSLTDIALNTVIVKWQLGDRLNLDSVLAMYPNSTSAIATVWQELADLNYVSDVDFFDVIYAAAAVQSINYSATLELIQKFSDIIASRSLKYAEYFFILFRNNQTWDDKIEAELTALEKFATFSITNARNEFFDAVVTLANAVLAGVATKEDFSAIQDGLDISLNGCNNFTQALSTAGVLVLNDNNLE